MMQLVYLVMSSDSGTGEYPKRIFDECPAAVRYAELFGGTVWCRGVHTSSPSDSAWTDPVPDDLPERSSAPIMQVVLHNVLAQALHDSLLPLTEVRLNEQPPTG